MSWLAKLSLANRGLVALVAVIVTAFGLLTIPNLKQQLFPSLDFAQRRLIVASDKIGERQQVGR